MIVGSIEAYDQNYIVCRPLVYPVIGDGWAEFNNDFNLSSMIGYEYIRISEEVKMKTYGGAHTDINYCEVQVCNDNQELLQSPLK